jgi:hypothetical protein
MAGLPGIPFKDFVKNPVIGVLFMSLLAIGYLYIDNRSTLTAQIDELREEVDELKRDNKSLNSKIYEMYEKLKDD